MGIEQTGNGGNGSNPLLWALGFLLLALVIYFGSLMTPAVEESPRPWPSANPSDK